MSAYDKDDLQSVLTYMRERFGFEVFENPSRMFSIISDLSPKMKPDGNVLRQLSEAGLFREMFAAKRGDALNQSRVLMKLRDRLTNYLFIADKRVDYYIAVLQTVYGMKTPPTIPAPPKPIPQPAPAPIRQPTPQPPTKPKAPIIKSGRTGVCTWTLDYDYVLTISGNGFMENYDYTNNKAPWLDASKHIQSVIIEHGVANIGNWAFSCCSNLKSVNIPDSVTSIGKAAFWGCSSLSSVRISDSVTIIGEHAFFYCGRLTSVRIPDSVTSIGDSAFLGCYRLTSVSVPRNAKIEPKAFDTHTKVTRR